MVGTKEAFAAMGMGWAGAKKDMAQELLSTGPSAGRTIGPELSSRQLLTTHA